MLARSGPLPEGPGWAFEVKFDGIRAQLRWDGRSLCLRSRPGRDCTDAFAELAWLAASLGHRRLLLDGELVCLDADGRPDFTSLRARLRSHGSAARAAALVRVPRDFRSDASGLPMPTRAAGTRGGRGQAPRRPL